MQNYLEDVYNETLFMKRMSRPQRKNLFRIGVMMVMFFFTIIIARFFTTSNEKINIPPHAQVAPTVATKQPDRILWQGQNWYLHGANVPWYSFQNDFGNTYGNGMYRLSDPANTSAVESKFAQLQAGNTHTVRWWFTMGGDQNPYGNNQILRDATGPTGLNTEVFTDFDTAIALADKYDLYYVFVLFGKLEYMPKSWINDPIQRVKLVDALEPIFIRYANSNRILSWELFNEPEFEMDAMDSANGDTSFSDNVKTLTNLLFSRIRSKSPATLISMGSRNLSDIGRWSTIDFDFLSPHWYDIMGDSLSPLKTKALDWQTQYNIKAPIVIGEFFVNDSSGQSLAETRYQQIRDNGFAGAWGWSLFDDKTIDHLKIDLTQNGGLNLFGNTYPDNGPKLGIIPTPSETPSPTPTETPTPTITPSPTEIPTPTGTITPSITPTPSSTPTPTITPSPTETPTPTGTITPSITPLPGTTSIPPTITPMPSPTAIIALQPTITPLPTNTPIPPPSLTPTITLGPSATPAPPNTTPDATTSHVFITQIGDTNVFISSEVPSTLPVYPIIIGSTHPVIRGIAKANTTVQVKIGEIVYQLVLGNSSNFNFVVPTELSLATYPVIVRVIDNGKIRSMGPFYITVTNPTPTSVIIPTEYTSIAIVTLRPTLVRKPNAVITYTEKPTKGEIQEVMHNVVVNVVDQSDKPINNVQVQMNPSMGNQNTNEKGVATFSKVTPGDYTLLVKGSEEQSKLITISNINDGKVLTVTLKINTKDSPSIWFWIFVAFIILILIAGVIFLLFGKNTPPSVFENNNNTPLPIQ